MTSIENIVTIIVTFAGLLVTGRLWIEYQKGQKALEEQVRAKAQKAEDDKENEVHKKFDSMSDDELERSAGEVARKARSNRQDH